MIKRLILPALLLVVLLGVLGCSAQEPVYVEVSGIDWPEDFTFDELAANEATFDTLNAPTGRTATYVIAASDASATEKAQADVVCDGVADDVQIQAGLNLGGKVYLTKGTFNIAGSLDITNSVELSGAGVNETKLSASTVPTGDAVFIYIESSHIKISGIYFYSTANPGFNAITSQSSVDGNLITEDVEISNNRFYGATISGHARPDNANDCGILKVIETGRGKNWRIHHNSFEMFGFEAVTVALNRTSTTYGQDITVTDNWIKGGYGGVAVEGYSFNVVVAHNIIDTFFNTTDSNTYGVLIYQGSHDNVVLGNTINTNDIGLRLGSSVTASTSNNVFTGNYVKAAHGILLSDKSVSNQFANNYFQDVAYSSTYENSGVEVQAGSSNNFITNNKFVGFSTYGVLLSAPTIFKNNLFKNCKYNYLLVGSAGSVFDGNVFDGSSHVSNLPVLRIYETSKTLQTTMMNNVFKDVSSTLSTTLSGASAAGATTLTLADASQFEIGQNIVITLTGYAAENKQIRDINYYTQVVTLNTAMTNPGTNGDAVTGNRICTNYAIYENAISKVYLVNNYIQPDYQYPFTAIANSIAMTVNNSGSVLKGEIRTYNGALAAGTVGNAVIAWQNPEAQGMMVSSNVRITTGGVATSDGAMGLASVVQVVENAEDVWTNGTHATNAVNTAYAQRGTYALAFTVTSPATNDILAYENFGAMDISTATHIQLRIMATTTTVAGDYAILLDEDNGCVSPSFTLNMPVLTANVMTTVVVPINAGAAGGATVNALVSVGLQYLKASSVNNVIYIDDIRAITVGATMFQALPIDTTGVYDSDNVTDAGTGVAKPIYIDARNGTNDTLVMVSATADSTGIVGSYYIQGIGE